MGKRAIAFVEIQMRKVRTLQNSALRNAKAA